MRILLGLAGTGCIIGAVVGTLLVLVGHGTGFTRFSGVGDLAVGLPGAAATLASGVFALAYAVTGEKRLAPHVAVWTGVAVVLSAVYAAVYLS